MKTLISVKIILLGLFLAACNTGNEQDQKEQQKIDNAPMAAERDGASHHQFQNQVTIAIYLVQMVKYTEKPLKEEGVLNFGIISPDRTGSSLIDAIESKLSKLVEKGEFKDLRVAVVADEKDLSDFDYVYFNYQGLQEPSEILNAARESEVMLITYNLPTDDYMINIYKDKGKILFRINEGNVPETTMISQGLSEMAME